MSDGGCRVRPQRLTWAVTLSPTVPEPVSPPLAGLAHLVGRATGQSLTSGNRIEPLIDGEQAYPAMLAAIESARHSVALASYAFDSQGIGAQLVDALRRAHARGVGSHDEREQTLNQLLTEMDGFDSSVGLIILAATNRPEILDQTRIDQAIRDIVMGVFDRAYRIIEINREVLERCARELLARETPDAYSFRQLTQGLQLESPCHSGPTAGAITSSVSQGSIS